MNPEEPAGRFISASNEENSHVCMAGNRNSTISGRTFRENPYLRNLRQGKRPDRIGEQI